MATRSAIEQLTFTQVGMKKGINIIREMRQFHDRNVVNPLKPEDITPDIKKKALGYLMFFRQKRNGAIKGRGCANDRPQRLY